MSAWRQTGKKPKELEELVELPPAMEEYWNWFNRLNTQRPVGMGISYIPYSEIVAFFKLLGISPEPYEVEIIEIFDRIAVKYFSEQQEKQQRQQEAKAKRK